MGGLLRGLFQAYAGAPCVECGQFSPLWYLEWTLMNEVVSFKTDVIISTMNANFEISTPWVRVVNFKQRSGYTSLLFTKCVGSMLPRKRKVKFWSFSQILTCLEAIVPAMLSESLCDSHAVLLIPYQAQAPLPLQPPLPFTWIPWIGCTSVLHHFSRYDEVKLNPWPAVHIKIKPSFKPWNVFFSTFLFTRLLRS